MWVVSEPLEVSSKGMGLASFLGNDSFLIHHSGVYEHSSYSGFGRWHVLFLLYEIVARRKPSDKFMEYAQMVGMFLLFALLIWANFNDIMRFVF